MPLLRWGEPDSLISLNRDCECFEFCDTTRIKEIFLSALLIPDGCEDLIDRLLEASLEHLRLEMSFDIEGIHNNQLVYYYPARTIAQLELGGDSDGGVVFRQYDIIEAGLRQTILDEEVRLLDNWRIELENEFYVVLRDQFDWATIRRGISNDSRWFLGSVAELAPGGFLHYDHPDNNPIVAAISDAWWRQLYDRAESEGCVVTVRSPDIILMLDVFDVDEEEPEEEEDEEEQEEDEQYPVSRRPYNAPSYSAACRNVNWPRPKVPQPSPERIDSFKMDVEAEATDGCLVEPDQECRHGFPSWLTYLNLI